MVTDSNSRPLVRPRRSRPAVRPARKSGSARLRERALLQCPSGRRRMGTIDGGQGDHQGHQARRRDPLGSDTSAAGSTAAGRAWPPNVCHRREHPRWSGAALGEVEGAQHQALDSDVCSEEARQWQEQTDFTVQRAKYLLPMPMLQARLLENSPGTPPRPHPLLGRYGRHGQLVPPPGPEQKSQTVGQIQVSRAGLQNDRPALRAGQQPLLGPPAQQTFITMRKSPKTDPSLVGRRPTNIGQKCPRSRTSSYSTTPETDLSRNSPQPLEVQAYPLPV